MKAIGRGWIRYARRLSQISFLAFFLLFVTGAVCTFVIGERGLLGATTITGPLGALQVFLSSGTLVTTLATALLIPIALTVLLGRFFCSWVCPMGSLVDLSDWVVTKRRVKPFLERKRSDGSLLARVSSALRNRVNSYAVLGSSLTASAFMKYPAFCSVCPLGAVCRTVYPGGFAVIEAAIVGIAASLSLGARRFWCRYLCPVGALLKITSRFNPFLKLKPHPEKCRANPVGCKACRTICPEGIELFDPRVQESSLFECTKCFECYIKCPYDAVELKLV